MTFIEIHMGKTYVHKGPAALREGRYWRGWKSGNIPCPRRRATPQRALRDADQPEGKL